MPAAWTGVNNACYSLAYFLRLIDSCNKFQVYNVAILGGTLIGEMAVQFGNLNAIRRGKELFYCFSEVKSKLFFSVGEDHLCNTLNFLQIDTLVCTEDENRFFTSYLPPQNGPFRLISEQNLLRLHSSYRFLSHFMQTFGPQVPTVTGDVSTGISPIKSQIPSTFQSEFDNTQNNCLDDQPGPSSKNDDLESDGRHLVNVGSKTGYSVEPFSDDVPQETSDSSCNENKKVASLSSEEMSPELLSDINEIRRFYSSELNYDRDGSALQNVTIDKMVERLSRFMWYLKNVKKVDPKFSYCADAEIVQQFSNYMMDSRSVKAVTCSRYISAFINVLKVPSVSSQIKDLTDSVDKVRAIQRQLERLARRDKVDDLAKQPALEKVVYSELLELCRELKWEVSEKTGLDQARSCMNLCLLLLYCSANPGRVKEYISLRIYGGQNSDECRNQNFLCFNQDGTVILYEDAYKTRLTYGPNRTDLTPLTFLTYYLKLYCTKMRNLLLGGKEHDFLFVNLRGDPFTHASYTNYVSSFFEKYFSMKLTTVDLRKAVVNHFLTLPGSSDPALRESFATLMKHSVRTQKRFYDERPLAQKKSKALDMLSSTVSRSLDEDGVLILSDEDEEGNIEYLPIPGDFVALVASNSTEKCPEVFIGKVLRLSEDHKTAYLAEYSETEPAKFKLSAGKSFKEAVNALIYPIDLVYLHSNGIYELRTPKIDIHRQVHKQ